MIWIGYTTVYRKGGHQLERAAKTMARQLRAQGKQVVCQAVDSKRAFVDSVLGCPAPLDELHLISHSGMYGPMFGTTDLPEQFSPHEWRTLPLRFAPGGQAYFHACRTGRWFAPFFARTFGVPAWGHHGYTTVSRRPDRYRFVADDISDEVDVYIIDQPGRTSHGLLGAVGKRTGLLPPVPMVQHLPTSPLSGAAYDRVAERYDQVFADIRVRGPEFAWLDQRVHDGDRVLDLGCGTGALLRSLRDRVTKDSVGVDVSEPMLEQARRRDVQGIYRRIDGPSLPFPDDHFDTVVSLLSWRYVDWDPMLAEVARVLRPGGRLLVVDMVAKAAELRELPVVLLHKLREKRHLTQFPHYPTAREALVTDPAWATMLQYNPIRAEHEYRWYFESRFPGRRVHTLDLGRRTRVLGFDSGPVHNSWFPPQSYP